MGPGGGGGYLLHVGPGGGVLTACGTGYLLHVGPGTYCMWDRVLTHLFNSTPATAGVLAVLRSAFAHFDLPEEVVSDNSLQFRSAEFNRFLAQMGIAHRSTPPLWPQANDAVERMYRTIGNVLRAAQLDGRDLQAALDEWLLAYRTTPHPATGLPPATVMFGRSIRDTLPNLCTALAPDATITANKEHAFRAHQCEAANQHHSA